MSILLTHALKIISVSHEQKPGVEMPVAAEILGVV